MKINIWHKLLLLFFLFVGFVAIGQTDSSYSIIVAGHAYGAHSGTNIGLHPLFLEKLKEKKDSSLLAVFLTGDIVNRSTTDSWNQVDKELLELGLEAYYVMGNHDDNSIGASVFQQKYGGTFYSFTYNNELYIILNSTESDRSISTTQLQFLKNVLENAALNQRRVFIFFHEVIWNSHEKYKLARSNSRSRYVQMIDHSNFWEEVFPIFIEYPEKNFYLFAGDVGGNPDAIAASYDCWGNVVLLSSGMGEVSDENYMQVNILPDTVLFSLIPLNDDVEMHPINWYNIPEKPSEIEGPGKITIPKVAVNYQVQPSFNATSYQWDLSSGISGSSDSSSIILDFDAFFQEGEISVSAINDGFGVSEPSVLEIKSDSLTSNNDNEIQQGIIIQQNKQFFQIVWNSENTTNAKLRVYNAMGKLVLTDKFQLNQGLNNKKIEKNIQLKGMVVLELTSGNKRWVQKSLLY